jgi:apolipoprotein N-acyltransferase
MIGSPLIALAVGGVMAALSSGRWQVGIAAWLAPAFLLYFTRSQDPLIALGGVFVAIFIAAIVSNRGVLPLAGAAYVITNAAQTVVSLIPFALDRLVGPELPGFTATLLFPVAWTAMEFAGARRSPTGTWGSLAYTQYGNLPFMQLASVTGLWGITFMVVWFGSTVSWAILTGLPSTAVQVGVVTYATAFCLLMLGGGLRLIRTRIPGARVRVAAIEPTGHQTSPDALMAILRAAQRSIAVPEVARRTLGNLHDLLLKASEHEILAGAAIVVWPEAGAPVFAEDEAALLERAQALARRHGIHLLLGIATIHSGPPFRLENKAVLIEGSGEVAFAYLKARPVPGWEAQVSLAGDGRIPVRAGPAGRLAAAICYDLDFPSLIRQAGRGRADLLLAPASDWPAIGAIHHAMASFRAVENGVSLVRAARWGVSSIVDPLGRVLAITDHRTTGADAAVAFAPAGGLRTIYARVGDVFAWLCVALTGGAVSWGILIAAGIV